MRAPDIVQLSICELTQALNCLLIIHNSTPQKCSDKNQESLAMLSEVTAHKQVIRAVEEIRKVLASPQLEQFDESYRERLSHIYHDVMDQNKGPGVVMTNPQAATSLRPVLMQQLSALIYNLTEVLTKTQITAGFMSRPVSNQLGVIEILFDFFSQAGFKRILLPLICEDYSEPPLFKKLRQSNRTPETNEGTISIEELLGLYSAKNEQIILFCEGIRWCADRFKIQEGWLRLVVLIHEIAHWIVHMLPKNGVPLYNTKLYNATEEDVHECLAQLMTFWVAQKMKSYFEQAFDQLNQHQSMPYKLYEKHIKSEPNKIISVIEELRWQNSPTTYAEFEAYIKSTAV